MQTCISFTFCGSTIETMSIWTFTDWLHSLPLCFTVTNVDIVSKTIFLQAIWWNLNLQWWCVKCFDLQSGALVIFPVRRTVLNCQKPAMSGWMEASWLKPFIESALLRSSLGSSSKTCANCITFKFKSNGFGKQTKLLLELKYFSANSGAWMFSAVFSRVWLFTFPPSFQMLNY